jgi:hypothetical protein
VLQCLLNFNLRDQTGPNTNGVYPVKYTKHLGPDEYDSDTRVVVE